MEIWTKQILSASVAINIYQCLPSFLIYIQYIDKLMFEFFWGKLRIAKGASEILLPSMSLVWLNK